MSTYTRKRTWIQFSLSGLGGKVDAVLVQRRLRRVGNILRWVTPRRPSRRGVGVQGRGDVLPARRDGGRGGHTGLEDITIDCSFTIGDPGGGGNEGMTARKECG